MAQRGFEQMVIYSMVAEVRCMQCQSGIIVGHRGICNGLVLSAWEMCIVCVCICVYV